MPVEVQMPNLGLSIVEGTIERWLKKEGDVVEKGELLVAIITEKVTVEIPAEVSGVLLRILCEPGQKTKVGETIALIGAAGERVEGIPKIPTPHADLPGQPPRPDISKGTRGDSKVSPLARKIASEHGIDIQQVAVEYPGGKIGKEEVLKFIEKRKEKEAHTKPAGLPSEKVGFEDEESVPLSGPLRAMAEHMTTSVKTAARVTTVAEVDMTALVRLRQSLKDKFQEEYRFSLTFVPFVMRAMAEGVREFPILNASLAGEKIIFHRTVNIGVAVDTGESLLVPVIKDVGHKTIVDLSREVSQLSAKAREGKLALPDIQGGTISLTNAGVYGALLATPIIHQPQSAILWMGKVMETPVVREGQIVIRSMMYLCLSYDHRIIMGAQAVRFLQVVKRVLENPDHLLLPPASFPKP